MTKILRVHRGCGGIIKNNKCTKCGQAWGIKAELNEDVEEESRKILGEEERTPSHDD